MKGIVFNLLEEVTCQQLGEETWDTLLEDAEMDGAYTSLGSYPDEDLMRLVAAASARLSLSPDEVVRWFGVHALPLMAKRYGQFFEGHRSTRQFLLTLNGVIHPEVLKLYPGADTPEFDYDLSSEDRLVMEYKSRRRMCAFAEGLITGAAAHYGEEVTIQRPKCVNRGDEQCLFHLSFKKLER
ncbi:MAG: heme NO-binding domain-containing protein [Acidobacteria bacterium]|nr:heme NO-binding domain-containing protein [Acidobacteriota bacterium]